MFGHPRHSNPRMQSLVLYLLFKYFIVTVTNVHFGFKVPIYLKKTHVSFIGVVLAACWRRSKALRDGTNAIGYNLNI